MIVGFFPATTMPDADWWQALWPDPAKVLAEMGVEPRMIVVDLCCGDGLFTVPLARIAKRVHAIDLERAMWDRASRRQVPRTASFRGEHHGRGCSCTRTSRLRFAGQYLHGTPDEIGLARTVMVTLTLDAQFGIANAIAAAPRNSGSRAAARPKLRCG